MKPLRITTLTLLTQAASIALAHTQPPGLPEGDDPAVRVHDDLHRAVNGGWIQRTEMRADKALHGSFEILRDLSDQRVRDLVESLNREPQSPGSEACKTAALYQSHLDEAAIDKAGLAPTQRLLREIDSLSWMSAPTKAQAQDKLSKYVTKIGYPDTWRDYSALQVRPGDAFGNHQRAAQFAWNRMIARAGQAADRREWGMTPQTINAYYSPTANEIVVPAAILQPPFFGMKADDAQNDGAIGAVIGRL